MLCDQRFVLGWGKAADLHGARASVTSAVEPTLTSLT
jgi:hypothetical protein